MYVGHPELAYLAACRQTGQKRGKGPRRIGVAIKAFCRKVGCMQEPKAPRAAGDKTGPFGNISTPNLELASRAMLVAEVYGIAPKEGTIGKFRAAGRAVAESRLPEPKKALFAGYVELAGKNAKTSFAMLQAVEAITSYLAGEVYEKELDFEFRLMKAWCSGNITGFLRQEAEKAKSKPASEMAEAALPKSDIMQAFAAAQFRRFYTRSIVEIAKRNRDLRSCTETIRAAPDVQG